ncbi:hypothetical protein [Sphingobacterium endophyticum]|uniref:hypothetical protein n=1 Tax=Sphingobacterium endophyticum TaxID=2546448 RepID=UPI0012E2566D|nr:hypothetical protein [Sphingobacterium endophyticum]
MDNRKAISIAYGIMTIILAVVLYKQFNFSTNKFDQPALAIVYGIALLISLLILKLSTARRERK